MIIIWRNGEIARVQASPVFEWDPIPPVLNHHQYQGPVMAHLPTRRQTLGYTNVGIIEWEAARPQAVHHQYQGPIRVQLTSRRQGTVYIATGILDWAITKESTSWRIDGSSAYSFVGTVSISLRIDGGSSYRFDITDANYPWLIRGTSTYTFDATTAIVITSWIINGICDIEWDVIQPTVAAWAINGTSTDQFLVKDHVVTEGCLSGDGEIPTPGRAPRGKNYCF